MTVIRQQPFSDMLTLRQAMNRLFDDSIVKPSRLSIPFGEGSNLPVDMYRTDYNVVVKARIPGVKPEEVEVTITGDTLTIKVEETRPKQINIKPKGVIEGKKA